jgi:hypothetical protein
MELKFRNMEWITTKHIQSTDGKTEKIYCELLLKFPTSEWNKKDKSIVLKLFYYDYKVDGGWWIDNDKTKWYTYPPHKYCEIDFTYFQRMPKIKINSSDKRVNYNNFTIEYCKAQAIEILKQRLRYSMLQLE